jgi:hypothetical protein
MGCLVPIVLYVPVFLLYLVISTATFRLGGSFRVLALLLNLAVLALPAIWALVVWARWFGRHS